MLCSWYFTYFFPYLITFKINNFFIVSDKTKRTLNKKESHGLENREFLIQIRKLEKIQIQIQRPLETNKLLVTLGDQPKKKRWGLQKPIPYRILGINQLVEIRVAVKPRIKHLKRATIGVKVQRELGSKKKVIRFSIN